MAAMSRQDFELIARVLCNTEAQTRRSCWDEVWRDRARVAEAFADELAQTNPRFDRARFLKACGVDS